jgi:hypothetical protein
MVLTGAVAALAASQLVWHDSAARPGRAIAVAQVSRPNSFVRCISPELISMVSVDDYSYCDTAVEPRVAVGPRPTESGSPTIVGVWQQDRYQNGGAFALMAAYSRDGGRTWGLSCLPFTYCTADGLRYEAASDPWVSIGPDGTVYAAGLILSTTGLALAQGVAAATSFDGGRTWRNVQAVVRDPPSELSDKESITADPLHPGVAYLIWDRTASAGGRFSQPPWFSRTLDSGRHWSKARPIPGVAGQTIGHEIVVDPRTGTLYDIFSRAAETGGEFCQPERQDCSNEPAVSDIAVIRSTDMGVTWSAPSVIARNRAVGPGQGFGVEVRVGTRVPEVEIDPRTGRLYAVFEDGRASRGRYDGIVLATSGDGGRHWTVPKPVPSPRGIPATTPSVAVLPNGRIGITYYTLRWRSKAQTYLDAEFWFVGGSPGGTRFQAPMRVAGPFNLLTAPWARGFFLGDYEGLASTGSGFVSLFAASHEGKLENHTEILSARIPGKGGR